MAPANGVIGLVAANLDLFALVDRFVVVEPQVHDGLLGTEPADGLHFLNLVRVQQEVLRTLKQFVAEIIFQSKRHHGNVQLVNDLGQLEHVVLGHELGLVNQHAVRLGIQPLNLVIQVHVLVNWVRRALEPNAASNLAHPVTRVQTTGHNDDPLALFLIVMGDL